ncbi:DUF1697 domain-containing protein [Tenacibaculum caenipelagi]|uniref:Uncharacterized protein (DUF1697 family) n=1 Tax=Tenacibaculum caenipelagi TaxID=1325435 RepID=A0A4R6TES6_9FLAO|nr:DUF1697 domain-containing protein [Tenacibaculum caenipelagi]TDQ27893.1 uncharacterized protein (DUF1697 family) [Tenacibaculum caenipelagi]
MNRYIILLRGINVSGKNKLPMAELREILNELGFQNVQTYIQSGNIILDSEERKEIVCQKIKEAIAAKFGYDVPVLARTPKEWKSTLDSYPFSQENEKIVAFTFLDRVTQESVIEVKGINEDKYKIVDDVVCLYCPSGFGKTKLTNSVIEKKLKVVATTRNLKTTIKLLELASS